MTHAILITASSAGASELGGGLLPEDVSPGVIGFLVTLALVLACIPLFRSMTGKLRGVQHRAHATEEAQASAGGLPASGEEAQASAGGLPASGEEAQASADGLPAAGEEAQATADGSTSPPAG